MVARERRLGETVTRETGFSSASVAEAATVGQAVRRHGGIEDRVHGGFDIAFREDEGRVRAGPSAQNFAILRHRALTLVRQEPTAKGDIKAQRLKAGWDETYLTRILGQLNP